MYFSFILANRDGVVSIYIYFLLCDILRLKWIF